VDDGSGELLDVVCGAANVTAGQRYPFARVGVTIPTGITLEKRKIRGQTSNGMLCSARELKLGDDHAGIMELSVDVPPGTPLLRALPLSDMQFVVDVLPNRPDLLSHLGVAREVSAATGKPLALPALPGEAPVWGEAPHVRHEGTTAGVTVRVDHALAPRYMGLVIKGVKVGPSPEWLVKRLESVGSRSINNVVDASNYVLHEVGQPTHAFDLARLAGATVQVRAARKGEKIVTLDGVERALDETVTVIADAERAHAIAGVMGGRDSEVTDATTDLFLEVAVFDARRTRTGRKRVGLSTDASYRFERGVDFALPPMALERLARLIMAVAGGQVAGPPVDVVEQVPVPRAVTVRSSRVAKVLGARVPSVDAAARLTAIGFTVDAEEGEGELTVVAPSWRADIVREIDVIEEIARLKGYDWFPTEIRPFRPGTPPDDPIWVQSDRVRETLVSLGLLEARPMPFTKGDGASRFVRVANPLAEDEPYLRRELLDTLARRAEDNLAHLQGNLRLFEIGSAFEPTGAAMPREIVRVGVLMMGDRHPEHFASARGQRYDEWDAKAVAERAARAAHPAADIALVPADGGWLWRVHAGGRDVGGVRHVALDAPVWAAPAFGVEIDLAEMPNADVAPAGQNAHGTAPGPVGRHWPQYRPVPTMPSAEFDLALLVPAGVTSAQVESSIRAASGELLERLQLFDQYTGQGVPEGMRSLAWRLTLRHPERTLRDKEIEGRRSKILSVLDQELHVRARTS
ncbi:MAG: phenylalanine--tRNA ligase subunit beta, partial [Gemmatimonadota bacterium]|nr:phenylalanine--tRNA ligase subunit beta [Gemmatimonadota bacterium]